MSFIPPPQQLTDKDGKKLPERPKMGGMSKMPMNNQHRSAKPGGNFTKPVRTMRAAKGR